MLEKLRERIAYSLVPKQKLSTINPYRLVSFFQAGQPIYTDMTVRKATREGYRLSIFVYRAIRTIVQAASGIPWIVLDKKDELIPDHPFSQVWSRPNAEFSGQDNMEFIIAHLKLVGNSLIQPVIVNRQPKEFWVCMPDMIKPIPADMKGEWLKGYQITDNNGQVQLAPPEQFIHFMQFDPGNPYWGIGDLQAAARTVDTDNEAQDTQKLSMQNRGTPDGIFSHEAVMTKEQFEEARERMRETFLQKTKRREPWFLGAGAKWQQMSLTPVEMDFIQSRLHNKRDIAAAFGISPIFLGDLEQSSYNNMAEAKRSLYEEVVIPLLDDIRSTLNLKIAPMYDGDIYITYDVSNVAALRDDFGKRIDQAKNLWAMGVPFDQINSRLELGFDEFEGWDTGYLPFNLMPAGSTPVEIEPAKMLTKALNLETEEQKSTHWKRIDRRRLAWWGAVSRKIKPLYLEEGKVVVKELSGKKAIGNIEKVIKELTPEWEKVLVAISFTLIDDFGGEIAVDLGTTFDPTNAAIKKWIKEHTGENIKTILDTNLSDVKAIIAKGQEEGLSLTKISKELEKYYDNQSSWKAMRVARTEVAQSAGYGQREAAEQSGVVKTHTWLTSRDDRVRDEHAALEGETVPFNKPFSNGEKYPGEASINCRCVESYGTEE